MKHVLKRLFFLVCSFSSISLSAAHTRDSANLKNPNKIYFDSNDLEISENVIFIHFGDDLIETNVVRNDRQGLYVFENDITNYGTVTEKKWKCPYCNHWWLIGQKCQNADCPTNKW